MLAVILVSSLFSDHMVLQRGRANAVWGTDQPKQVITLTVENPRATAEQRSVQVTTGADGKWQLACPELPTGGPYRLHLAGSSEQVIDDVLVGDVWLASGQSNMEFPLSHANNAEQEIAAANFPEIRVAKIPRLTARAPLSSVETAWDVATPTNAGAFTAIGYFFARDLQQHLHIPIGIIDSTWGGTRVEAWTSHEGLRAVVPGIDAELASLQAPNAERERIRAEYFAKRLAWEKTAFPQDTTHVGEEQGWARLGFDDHAWRTMVLPTPWQAAGFNANGAVWFRRTVDVAAVDAGHDLVLHLGAIDDFDTSYWNGERVGATQADTPDAYQVLRVYVVPGRLVRAGANVIAVKVFDRFGEGGMTGPGSTMYLESSAHPETRIPLAGAWRWQVEREIPLVSSEVYNGAPPVPAAIEDQNTATVLYNGMIAPLIPFGLRGIIWYQGEANVREHSTYRDRFTAMIRDWRGRWGEGTLPFYFVQLASFTESGSWPYLREAQAQTLAEPATGMAVTMDVGEIHNIHPRNKQDVGHRLALIARQNCYGEDGLVISGPTLDRVEISGATVVVEWKNAKGLRTHDGTPAVRGFELAGADGTFHPAEAHVAGQTVVLTSAAVTAPQTVRYAWADWVDVNLENSDGLPATPFRTDGF